MASGSCPAASSERAPKIRADTGHRPTHPRTRVRRGDRESPGPSRHPPDPLLSVVSAPAAGAGTPTLPPRRAFGQGPSGCSALSNSEPPHLPPQRPLPGPLWGVWGSAPQSPVPSFTHRPADRSPAILNAFGSHKRASLAGLSLHMSCSFCASDSAWASPLLKSCPSRVGVGAPELVQAGCVRGFNVRFHWNPLSQEPLWFSLFSIVIFKKNIFKRRFSS